MRLRIFVFFACAAALASACHSSVVHSLSGEPPQPARSQWIVAGTATNVCTGGPARGRLIRLMDTDGKVLAEDTSGVDGSFILRPEAGQRYRDGIYLESEGRKNRLVDDAHAEYLQSHVFKAWVNVDCHPPQPDVQKASLKVPLDAGTPEAEPVHAPSRKAPSNLIPHGYLGG